MQKRVVITGLGPLTTAGIGKNDFFSGMLNGGCPAKKIPGEFMKHHDFKSVYYSPAPEVSLADFGLTGKYSSIMQKEDKIACICARLAVEDSGIKDLSGTCVIVGIGCKNLQTAFNSYLAHIKKNGDNSHFNRMVIPMVMPNSVASWISILFNAKGGACTVNASCASGTFAIGEAYNRIKSGLYKSALAGGVECLEECTGSIMRGFDALGVLTKSENGMPEPFSENRSGFLFSEGGGCVLVLEELEHALHRGADIYAEIADFRENSDSYNIVQMDPSGNKIADIFERLSCGRKIDYINAHGTGTELNDEVEAEAIRKVFGDADSQPLVNSTKGIIGHTIGASGAIEACVTAMSIKDSKVHGNRISRPMKSLNLPLKTVDSKIDYAISASFGFGGHNAALLLRNWE